MIRWFFLGGRIQEDERYALVVTSIQYRGLQLTIVDVLYSVWELVLLSFI